MKYFLSAIINFSNFHGRACRKEFWYFMTVNIVLFSIACFISIKKQRPDIAITYMLITIVPTISVGYRRMHDIGEKGWVFFIPVYNFVIACIEGSNRTNRFGEDPKRVIKNQD